VPIGGAEEKIRDRAILNRFAELCGGRTARLVIIPTASSDPETGSRHEQVFRDMGVKSARSVPFESRSDCRRSEWLRYLERADGVFLTGGNQLKLATTLGGTPVADMLRSRNKRGMHVAGTSAGAAFLSEHMIAFGDEGPTPRSSMVTLSPGLGLSKKVIVDQHFRQRDRLGRLLTAISYNPKAIGIGLDEDTAAFIGPDEIIKVTGSGALTIVDPGDVEYTSMDSAKQDDPVSIIGLRLHVLVDGSTYDLTTRKARPADSKPDKS
jgi:cyanophycinase